MGDRSPSRGGWGERESCLCWRWHKVKGDGDRCLKGRSFFGKMWLILIVQQQKYVFLESWSIFFIWCDLWQRDIIQWQFHKLWLNKSNCYHFCGSTLWNHTWVRYLLENLFILVWLSRERTSPREKRLHLSLSSHLKCIWHETWRNPESPEDGGGRGREGDNMGGEKIGGLKGTGRDMRCQRKTGKDMRGHEHMRRNESWGEYRESERGYKRTGKEKRRWERTRQDRKGHERRVEEMTEEDRRKSDLSGEDKKGNETT